MSKWVYFFGKDRTEGDAGLRNLLGGKGANLAEMCQIGLPVPPGFTITTDVCSYYYENNLSLPKDLSDQVLSSIQSIETIFKGPKFGDKQNPLLFSVRSGARASMPGMMDTVLNLGLNDETVEGLANNSNDARFAYDSYRRFIQMYGNVVLGIDSYDFEEILEDYKDEYSFSKDTDLSETNWKEVIKKYNDLILKENGSPFPQDVHKQLYGAIEAVFKSWQNQRAITYRKLHDIPDEWGTAVNVQAMVFGNMGDDCATGVAFTRNPSTGQNDFYGEYLINAQGEDVVAGIRTPQPLTIKNKQDNKSDLISLEEVSPDTFKTLCDIRQVLENHFKDMQDIEFTIQKGQVWMLQTRTGKRTSQSAIKIAVDMVEENLISEEEALLRVDPLSLNQLLHPTLDPNATKNIIARGLPASPGAVSGKVVFNSDKAEKLAGKGEDVILVRIETSPDDIHGMHAAKGILTARGGMTSHAAVVARGMGRSCVSGAGDIHINYKEGCFTAHNVRIEEGEIITLDGSSGEVYLGQVKTLKPEISGDFQQIMEWADRHRTMNIRANAETLLDAKTSLEFGAEGIGLCRTEHMFFDPDRILAVREMILANDAESRKKALTKILPMQKQDFYDLFKIMNGLPITVRLLDPPLHEFLPHRDDEYEELANALNLPVEDIRYKALSLKETNPMLGHRGCRLGITAPEIYEMQAKAIFEAAIELEKNEKIISQPEIMIPLVVEKNELSKLRSHIEKIAEEVFEAYEHQIDYKLGSMIELPRAALKADEISSEAEFFSFGTNDLTQATFGLSRDDSGQFFDHYLNSQVITEDPFVHLDQEGVGTLIQIACEKSLEAKPSIKLGICGEHGGDPKSIAFFHKVGLDYVSCSPYRVPIARLSAAQSAIRDKNSHVSDFKQASSKRDVA